MTLKSNRGTVHQKILDLLSDQKWHSKDELYNLTGQTYYDRRIRELRDEEGWKIEHEIVDGEHGYRLTSPIKGKGKRRHYVSAKKRKEIFKRDNYTCELCGNKYDISELQIDHKIPLYKGGSLEDDNLQTTCVECNVVKRGICKRCKKDDCVECYLAHPELMKNNILLNIPEKIYEKLSIISEKTGKSIHDIIIEKIS